MTARATSLGRPLAVLLTAALLTCSAAACGDRDAVTLTTRQAAARAAAAAAFLAAHPVDLVFADCSSFRRHTEAFVPDMVTVAMTSARAGRTLWAGCFDGAPLRWLDWDPKVDFADLPPDVRRNAQLAKRVALARALGLRRALETMVETTPRRVRGSGQLEALELAAETDRVGRVFMFTDGVIHQIDGIRLGDATPAEVERTIARWAPRLSRLAGVELHMIGVGRGTRRTAVVRRAEHLFRGLAERVGVARFTWSLELPPGLDVARP